MAWHELDASYTSAVDFNLLVYIYTDVIIHTCAPHTLSISAFSGRARRRVIAINYFITDAFLQTAIFDILCTEDWTLICAVWLLHEFSIRRELDSILVERNNLIAHTIGDGLYSSVYNWYFNLISVEYQVHWKNRRATTWFDNYYCILMYWIVFDATGCVYVWMVFYDLKLQLPTLSMLF